MLEWCRLATAEFEMYSSMPKNQMVTLAQSLQALHSIAVDLVPGEFPRQSLLKVIAFEDIDSFVNEFQSDQYIGYMQPSMRQHVLTFGLATHSKLPYEIAFHEYTHYISRSRYDHFIPMWYEEGFAQYMGLLEISGAQAEIGNVSTRRMIRAIRRNAPKWRTILDGVPRIDWHKRDFAEHYAFAHAVTHFLHHGVDSNGHAMASKVQDILISISDGSKASEILPVAAGVKPENFIRTLINHFRLKGFTSNRIAVNAEDFSPHSEFDCLSEVDARILLASATVRNNPNRALFHITRALKIEPQNPRLQVLMSYLPQLDTETPFERISRALEIDASNVDANIRMGDLLAYNCLDAATKECETLRRIATQHYRRALIEDPLRVDAAFGLGVSLLRSSRAGDSLNYLRVAYERLPWNSRVNLFLGDAYRQIGDQPKAVFHLKRTVMWEVEESVRQQAIELLN